MSQPDPTGRRSFLKTAGVLAVGTAAAGAAACDVRDPHTRTSGTDADPLERRRGFDRALLDAVAAAMLPELLGTAGIRAATARFVAWADGYEPVAEEMHGYGYAHIRYLPADPSPAWRAQLAALDLLARKSTGLSFTSLPMPRQREVLRAVLRTEQGERLPSPLGARHVAMALLGHWAASPEAWDLALGVRVTPGTCRTLDGATRKPLPLGEAAS